MLDWWLIQEILKGVSDEAGYVRQKLQKQIKVRIDEVTFNKITEFSEEAEKNTSWVLRDIIITGLRKLYKDQWEDIINPPEKIPEGFLYQ